MDHNYLLFTCVNGSRYFLVPWSIDILFFSDEVWMVVRLIQRDLILIFTDEGQISLVREWIESLDTIPRSLPRLFNLPVSDVHNYL